MAKKAAKETSLPLIISLVFFVLTTIGLGVFVYVLYSDQEAKDAAVAKAAADLKNARTGEAEALMIARVNRIFAGLDDPDDRTVALSEIKEGDKAYQEIKRLNAALADRAPKSLKKEVDKFNASLKAHYAALAAKNPAPPELDVSSIAVDDVVVWPEAVDAEKRLKAAPTANLLDFTVRSRVFRDLALKQTGDDRTEYAAAVASMKKASDDYDTSRKGFDKAAKDFPTALAAKTAQLDKDADARKAKYEGDYAKTLADLDKLNTLRDELAVKQKGLERQITDLKQNLAEQVNKNNLQTDPLQYDAPQGKVTKRLPNRVVEIDLGSNALVTPGLTFSVLPNDYPEKGRQSRVKVVRAPDEKGVYRNVEQFTPKATLEVIEVLGPDLSRARLTSEADDIRDAVLPGDLLYNSVWRKGQADHIALIGIFDTNGDGSDDIEAVVRDLTKMGVPVDAYFDLRTLKWVGKLTERTRYVVEGHVPLSSANDPNAAGKTRMTGAISDAKKEVRNKSIQLVNFRDFFGKMGYRVRPDVSEDRINQAAAKYLTGVGAVEAPPENPN